MKFQCKLLKNNLEEQFSVKKFLRILSNLKDFCLTLLLALLTKFEYDNFICTKIGICI